MVHLVSADSSLEAWRKGAKLLVDSGDLYNVITTITNPTMYDVNWLRSHNPAAFQAGMPTSSEVATTIFPYKYLGRGYTRTQLYARYKRAHERAKKLHPTRGRLWGTYFDRMTRFGDGKVNQLERVIVALRNWQNNPKAALVMHISSADTDKPRPLGGPCLQYLELLCPDRDTVSLLVVYRNHDYFAKVLGNFIGLGQLLRFICEETNRQPGTLICHSAHACNQSSKSNLRSLAQL